MKKIVSAIFIYCLFASACVLHRGGSGSFDALGDAYGADAQALAAQAAEELSERHAPAHTPLALQRVPGFFGDTLESHLRVKGFALVPAGTGSSIGVKYRLDALAGAQEGEPLGYVQISCTDGQIFSFSRGLSEQALPYTEPPHTRPVPDEHPLESRLLPDSAPCTASVPVVPSPPAQAMPIPKADIAPLQGTARTAPVRSKATAAVVARRSGFGVANFCRWNGVSPDTILAKGRSVYLSEPPVPVISDTAPVGTSVAALAPRPSAPSILPPPAPMSSLAMPTAITIPASTDATPTSDSLLDSPQWEITKGQMLRGQMEGWAAVAGYSLIWNAHNDYEMQSSAAFTGEFIEAVKTFFAALQANGLALRVTIYQGNKVMEVSQH